MRLSAVSLALILLILSGCSPRQLPEQQSPPSEPPRALKIPTPPDTAQPKFDPTKFGALAKDLNQFGFKLFADISKSEQGNFAVSPVGPFVLLELLRQGAEGDTKADLAKVLDGDDWGPAEAANLLWVLNQNSSLAVAQKIFVDSSTSVKSDFLESIDSNLTGSIESVSFKTDIDEAQKSIASWSSEQTGGLLGAQVPLREDTLCVLLSTLLYQGDWVFEFQPSDTKDKPFTCADGTEIQVPTMWLDYRDLDYFQQGGVQIVALPYEDELEMLLVLPEEGSSPAAALASLDFAALTQSGDYRVTLELPRFEVKTPSLELTAPLKALGAEDLEAGADLSGMLDSPDARKFGVRTFQEALVRVNETGTVAAAGTEMYATPASTETTSEILPTEIEIHLDRPFAFVIRHKPSKAVVFLGQIERPNQS